MTFYDVNNMPYREKRDEVQVKTISGERVQMVFVKLAPGFTSDHSHPHEQMGWVLAGALELTIGGETKCCGVGCAYHIPGNLRH